MARQGQDPREVKPIAKADPLVTSEGCRIEFLQPEYSFSPEEMKMFSRWLMALSSETFTLGHEGLISNTQSYNVSTAKVEPSTADK